MLKARRVWPFLCCLAFGTFAMYAIGSQRKPGITILILLAPAALLAFPSALRQAAGGVRTVLRSWTWWQGLWLLLFMSMFVLRQRSDTEIRESPLDAAALYRVVLVGITAAMLAIRLAVKRPAWLGSLFRGLVGALTCYCAISAFSALWSVYPAWTLYKSLEYLVDVALVAAVLAAVDSAQDYAHLLSLTWVLIGLLLVSVGLGAFLWPQEAWQSDVGLLGVQLYGVVPAIHPNSVGEFGAIVAVVAFSRLLLPADGKSNRAWYGLIWVFGLAALILSQTRSAIAGFLLGTILVLAFSKGKGLATFLLSGLAGLLFLGGLGSLLWRFLLRGQNLEMFESLSGRVNWWELAWGQFLKSPWVGLGAYTARFDVLAKVGEADTASLHNTYLEVIFGVGIVGLIPVLVALIGTWRSLIRALRTSLLESLERGMAVEALGVLAVVSVRSLFTSNLIWHPSLQFLVLLGYAEFVRRRLKRAREPARL